MTYVLVHRRKNAWSDFLIIPREELYGYYANGLLGQQTGNILTWNFQYFPDGTVKCQDAEFTRFVNAWDTEWPSILENPE